MKKLIFTLVLVLCSIASWASVVIDGIRYYLDSTTGTASVENANADCYEMFISHVPSYSGEVIIPETVTYEGKTYTVNEIGMWAFCKSELSLLDIPATVTKIGDAFGDAKIAAVKVHWTEPFTMANDFTYEAKHKLYVPKGTAEKYFEHSKWNKFEEMYEFDEDGTVTTIKYKKTIDGIYYQVITVTQSATVTYKGDPWGASYSGNVVIPRTINIDDATYNVTSIGQDAFYYCRRLTSVKIPDTVTSIENQAFYACTNITSVTNCAVTPQTIGTGVFQAVETSKISLYVPMESVDAYKAADIWKNMNIVGVKGQVIEGINFNDDDNDDDNLSPRKVIENGKVVIETSKGKYTLSGQRME